MIKLTVEGIVYEVDDGRMLIAEARELKKLTGLSVPKFWEGVNEVDADAVAGLVFLAKRRAGETLRFSDLDSLDIADVRLEPVEDEEDAEQGGQQAAAPADPTPPSDSGTTPTDGTGATSAPSPTTSSTTLTASTV